jgi:hypothetical protein
MDCFIASAFNYNEVDAIYDRVIRPVLSEFNLRPLRVDRVEHNDDIDDQIFKLIDQSQILIADLTYARPSVYYEAGYASGMGKPVIYFARKDHFHARPDDPAGNFRVHFDLQMKNIISWTEPNETLKRRLRSRLRHVLKPILREHQGSKVKQEQERRFANQSQYQAFIELIAKSSSILRSLGYKTGEGTDFVPLRDTPRYAHLIKTSAKIHHHVHIIALNTVNKTSATYPSWVFTSAGMLRENRKKLKRINSIFIFVTRRNLRAVTLVSLFPSWVPIAERMFSKSDTPQSNEVSHLREIAVIDGVKSVEDFASRFKLVIDTFERGQEIGCAQVS